MQEILVIFGLLVPTDVPQRAAQQEKHQEENEFFDYFFILRHPAEF